MLKWVGLFVVMLWASNARADGAEVLAAAAVAWQPTRAADEPLLRQISRYAIDSCARMRTPLPDRDRCPALIVALAFHESSWRPRAVGPTGPRGLLQLHGRAARGHPRWLLLDPATNISLATQWLDDWVDQCRPRLRAGGPSLAELALSGYGTGRCMPSRMSRRVLGWTDRIHALTGAPGRIAASERGPEIS